MIDQAIQDTEPQKTYSITELCKEFGVTPRTLRYYGQINLLTPVRRGWTRIFSQQDRTRLKLILRGKRFGFSLTEIKELLELYDCGDGQLTDMQVAVPKFEAQLELLKEQRDELSEAIADLEDWCTQLNQGPSDVMLPRASNF